MNCETTVYITDLIFLIALCLFESTEMGILGSRFQLSSQGPEEATEGTSTNRKHSCECKKRKRNAQCDCDSEQEEDDGILDTPRRQVRPVQNQISLSCLCFVLLSFFSVLWFFSVFLEQEEIKKHIKVHLSDLVSEWGKQWHSYLRSRTGVEPPQSVPLPGKTNTRRGIFKAASVTLSCMSYHIPALYSRGISPACSAGPGRSPAWWKSTWRSQIRTLILKVRVTENGC